MISGSLTDLIKERDDNFFDLEWVRSPSTKPRSNLAIRRFINDENGFIPDEEFKKGIEEKVNEFFLDRHMELLPQFTKSRIWNNFDYMIALVDLEKYQENGKFNYDSIVGLLLAFTTWTKRGFKIRWYSIIAIASEHRGNSYSKDLIRVAQLTNAELYQKEHSSNKIAVLAGLKTSSHAADRVYREISDYKHPTNFGDNKHGDGNYIVHLFGFKNLYTGEPIREYSSRIPEVVEHIASMPPSFRKLETCEFMHRQILRVQKCFGQF